MTTSSLRQRIADNGAVLLPPGEHPYGPEEVRALRALVERLPRPAGIGEENRVSVGRVVVDPVDVVRAELGYAPARVEDPAVAAEILAVAYSAPIKDFWERELDLHPPKLRRTQANFLLEGGEVSWHTDHESNPDYVASVVLGLSSDYAGGEFLADDGSTTRRFRVEEGAVLVARPDLRHAVTPVESGTRVSLVMFLV